MKIAILTEILSTHSGSRAPIELAKKLPLGNEVALLAFAALNAVPYLKHQDFISFHSALPGFLAAKLSGAPVIKTYYGTQLDAYRERFSPQKTPDLWEKLLNWIGNQIIVSVQRFFFTLSSQSIAIRRYASLKAQQLTIFTQWQTAIFFSGFHRLERALHEKNS